MIGAAFARWLGAVLIALVMGTAQVLDADPEALQDVADEAAAIVQDVQRLARVDAALTMAGEQRP